MLKMRQFFLLLSIISFTIHDADIQHAEADIRITVFIHGAVTLGPMTPVTHFDLFMSDKVSGSLYEKIIKSIRADTFFFESQPIRKTGLHEMELDDIKPGCAAEAFGSIFDILSKHVGRNNTLNKYYTYGWAGAFGKKCRQEYARQLYNELVTECADLKKRGFNPIITLVGYCHGAQLILELASIAKEHANIPLYINESVLIGMPISPDTASCIASPVFKKVIVLSSKHDRIQPIDVFVGKKLWNKRIIPTDNPATKEKLTQIDLRIYKPFGSRESKIPDFSDKKNIAGRKSWRNQSPGHIEFWFFHWTPSNYRENWILSPFPAAVFLPIILQYVNEERAHFADDQPIIVDIRPDHEIVLIRQHGMPHIKKKQWIPRMLLEELKKIASSAKPSKKRTQKEYSARIKFHIRQVSRQAST